MVKEILRVLIVQPDIHWKDILHNLNHYTDLLKSFEGQVDLILLPEMFNTGYLTTPGDISPEMQQKTVSWLQEKATAYNCSIAGSMIFKQHQHYYNRLICVHPDAEINLYNKRHLFSIGGELKHFTRGTKRTVSIIQGWRICWQVCYDIRFPVWSRSRDDYDILVYVANWPAQRSAVWKTLLKARAIENQSYVIGVNRIGRDGNQIEYIGESSAIDPKGNVISMADTPAEKLFMAELSYSRLIDFREKFPVLKDRDDFTIL